MNRAQAYEILNKYLTNPNLIKHSLAAEAAMRSIYAHLFTGKNFDLQTQEKWGITGLLHDADYEMCKGHPEIHGLLLFEKEATPFPEDIKHAIKAHNYQYTNIIPKSAMDCAIACCDQLTGLIVAAALILPDKKLASVTTEFVLRKMDDKNFAKGADRTSIRACEEKLGISLPEFISITLKAMQGISTQLG